MVINADVKKILERFKNQLPTSEGLILRPCAAVRARRALIKARRKFATLPKQAHRGRPRLNSKYCMRVGVKAQTSRKVCYYVHILAHKVHLYIFLIA